MNLIQTLLASLCFIITTNVLVAQNDPFITTWNVESNDTITIPLQSGTYNFDFEWTLTTDTSVQIAGMHTNADGDFTTNFVDAGIYELEISGEFPHLRNYPKSKLLDVLQWGDNPWRTMSEMFRNWPGSGFSAVDAPNLAQASSLFRMFDNAGSFNEDLNHWDVSTITNLNSTFRDTDEFDGDITNWDVSNVTNMRSAFLRTKKFNQDISGWNTSQVTTMQDMFRSADKFNQPIGSWDVSNVTSMLEMFDSAESFNHPIETWDVSRVMNMSQFLIDATNFNQSLGQWKFNSNANLNSLLNNRTNISCENWTATIIGWNFNNPQLDSVAINNGLSFDFDTTATRSFQELVNRSWVINGTQVQDNCGVIGKIRCQDTVLVANDTLFGELLIPANELITLENILIEQPGAVTISAPEVELKPSFELDEGIELEILQAQGCP